MTAFYSTVLFDWWMISDGILRNSYDG